MNAVDRFAQIEAEFKAIEKLYKAAKAEMLEACMDACASGEFKSALEGDMFKVEYSMIPVMSFSKDRAIELGFITEEECDASKVQSSRQTLKVSAKAKPILVA